MVETFSYETRWRVLGQRQSRVRVFFYCDPVQSESQLINDITSRLDRSIPPDQIVVLTTTECRDRLEASLRDPGFIDRLPSVTRHSKTPQLFVLSLSEADKLDGNCPEWLLSKQFASAVKHDGLVEIFRKRNGMLKTNPLYHFVKPSGKHSVQFIRTAELLKTDGEISFIAATLLPWFCCDNLRHVFCDTSSITVLGYAAAQLKSQTRPFPRIHSFSSYGGMLMLKDIPIEESLFLISSSTSGNLAKAIIDQTGISPERVATIFYLGRDESPGRIVCDLRQASSSGSGGYEVIESFDSSDCPFCRKGLNPIFVLEEQFLPKEYSIETYLVKAKDAPDELAPFMKDVYGTDALRCHYDEGKYDAQSDIYLDLSALFSKSGGFKDIRAKLKRVATRALPASLARIVHLDDACSKRFAEYLFRKFREQSAGERKVQILPAEKLLRNPNDNVLEEGTTLVVGSCLATGRSLQAVSQVLRNTQKNDSLCYLIGVSRTQSIKELDEVRSNLCYGPTGPREHSFDVIAQISLPDRSASGSSCWGREEGCLHRVKEAWEQQSEEPLNQIDERLAVLREASNKKKRGLIANVFWGRLDGEPLVLRRNFAFFPFDHEPKRVSQADVYTTIAAVLHKLRRERKLCGDWHHRILLSPRCFDRFNDGVIQAAFLRAALPSEIDYTMDKSGSVDMKDIVVNVARNHRNETGEALMEFLIAIAMGRLQLRKTETDEIVRACATASKRFVDCRALTQFILKPHP